jgi:hypothetical protein
MESLRKPHSTQDRRFRVAWFVLRNNRKRTRSAAHSTHYVRALARKDWGKPQSLSQQNQFLGPYVNMGLYENETGSEFVSVAGRVDFDSGWWFEGGEGTKLGFISYYIIFIHSPLCLRCHFRNAGRQKSQIYSFLGPQKIFIGPTLDSI